MAYADYAFYTDTYKGNAIPKSEFERLILRASSYIDRITGGRSASSLSTDAVKMAACAVAEAWQINEQGGDMVSQSVGSWSRSYANKPKSNDARLLDAATLYLASTGLLTRWC